MGGVDKALVDLAGQPLLTHVIRRFSPQVEDLALSANGDSGRFAAYNLTVLADATAQGPLSGILQALRWAATHDATAVVSVPVDGPFLPPDLVPRLCLAAESSGVAVAASNGIWHPTYGLWSVNLAPALAAFLASGAKSRIRDFALAHNSGIANFAEDGAFGNANTPEDIARLTGHLLP